MCEKLFINFDSQISVMIAMEATDTLENTIKFRKDIFLSSQLNFLRFI